MAARTNDESPTVAVDPHLLSDEAEHIAARLPSLLVEADRVAHTVAQGLHGRRRSGSGEAFWQFRRYRPGDQPSMIDWRKSARRQVHLIRENEWEAANTVWMWADSSGSMQYRSRLSPVLKADRATLLMLALGHLLSRAGERIGPLGSGMPARSGQNAVRRIAEYLAHTTETPDRSGSLPPMQDLGRFSHVVLFSDFLEPVEQISSALAGLAARDIRGHLVQVLDPSEETFPFAGRKEFRSMTGSLKLTVGRAETLRQGYRERLERHNGHLREITSRLGWSFTTHHTDAPPTGILLALFGLMSGQPGAVAEPKEAASDTDMLREVAT